VGAGQEKTAGQCDTPGFKVQDTPTVQVDHRHSLKLNMKRNHSRVHQTSMDVLQSWRANCDVQILVYSSDPEHPDADDIARVTDYVVGYACKGNNALKEEREQSKQIVLA
jgi:hypothetical protein